MSAEDAVLVINGPLCPFCPDTRRHRHPADVTPQGVVGVRPSGLTRRQLDILSLVADGLRHSEIGKRLGISRWTIQTDMGSVLRRLHTSSAPHAVAIALREGFIE